MICIQVGCKRVLRASVLAQVQICASCLRQWLHMIDASVNTSIIHTNIKFQTLSPHQHNKVNNVVLACTSPMVVMLNATSHWVVAPAGTMIHLLIS
jgi:hypothetical protein